jgi:hypothetical protein
MASSHIKFPDDTSNPGKRKRTNTRSVTDAELGASTEVHEAVVIPPPASSSTLTNQAWSATNVTLFAANANRLGAIIYNDTDKALYIKLGATATTSSFSYKLASLGHWELPFNYVGIIDGIGEAAGTGSWRLTEL